jgi:hypothetical protein
MRDIGDILQSHAPLMVSYPHGVRYHCAAKRTDESSSGESMPEDLNLRGDADTLPRGYLGWK